MKSRAWLGALASDQASCVMIIPVDGDYAVFGGLFDAPGKGSAKSFFSLRFSSSTAFRLFASATSVLPNRDRH
jgi:hypothetical protein